MLTRLSSHEPSPPHLPPLSLHDALPICTVVHELAGQTDAPSTLHIVHPTGTTAVSTSSAMAHGQCKITQSVVNRSARVLMQGIAYAYVEDEMVDYRPLSGDERIITPGCMQSRSAVAS